MSPGAGPCSFSSPGALDVCSLCRPVLHGHTRGTANKSCLDSRGAVGSCNLRVEHLQASVSVQSTLALQWLLNRGEHCAGRHKSLQRAPSPRSGFVCLRIDFSVLQAGGESPWKCHYPTNDKNGSLIYQLRLHPYLPMGSLSPG